jgi:OmpA-OmpF porin, OOP family
MSNSVFSALTNLLDRSVISSIASRIGESDVSVVRGLKPAIAAILGGLAEKANDPGVMASVFDMILGVPPEAVSREQIVKLASSGAAGSPLFDAGRRLAAILFNGKQETITAAIQETSGLSSAGAARLMAAVAPVVLGCLAKRVHTEGIGQREFTSLLRSELSDVRNYVPLGIIGARATAAVSGVRAVGFEEPVSTSKRWLLPVLVAIATLASVFWFAQQGSSAHGEANRVRFASDSSRVRSAFPGLGEFVDRELPDGIVLNIPENGMEAHLLSLIQGSTAASHSGWFNFDRITFDTSSALFGPESEEQLLNVAAILKAYPKVRLKIGGYADNLGTAKANMRLSQNRADAVTRELTSMGISADRLESEGYGEQHPVRDNSAEEGRAMNRRIAMRILRK